MKRLLLGITITVFGACLLLASLNLYNMEAIVSTWWPLLFVVLGLLSLMSDSKNYLWPVILIAIGLGIILDNAAVLTIDVEKIFFPALVIIGGLLIITKSIGASRQTAVEKSEESISVFMAGSEQVNNAKDYKGGSLTAVLGGIELDLSHAKIVDGAVLDVMVFAGGIELRVPENVVVKSRALCLLGGIENKQRATSAKAPTLYIDGTIALGGIEVKR